ncbi:transcriptional regulator with XRE-family HTH domain [Actinopolyspora biskrensis]|uniref:Transcriptional regulator with XRE-family HTH domain n=1 Tax=Actinopolyspora biskrensis TaxID=1470178 RepID=A0A852YUD3_9ACTN|nr:helix-turn-helix transcriptional regulator [Actinopolyspora biskrensis]NYH77179.1 transcriptional regulator with XRE-family HTH domain [Actinopolyspora biskrensis]
MTNRSAGALTSADLGARVRMIRRRRGLGLEVVAGLAGISKSYLSRLESGHRQFDRRGLIEDLASALGCSIADITGAPMASSHDDHEQTHDALAEIRAVLHTYDADDLPDVAPRPLSKLVHTVDAANADCAQAQYHRAAREAATLVAESQAQLWTSSAADRRTAVRAAVLACFVAGVVSSRGGNIDLAAAAARRGHDLAQRGGDPGLAGFARWYWSLELTSTAARTRATTVLTEGITELSPTVRWSNTDTLTAEMTGLLHLQLARTAARQGDGEQAHLHLDEADRIAAHTGEQDGMRQHFGPSNAAAWRLSTGIELGEGPRVYDEVMRAGLDVTALGSRERASSIHFDLARALTQHDRTRDAEAVRHLDAADRIAPQRLRPDPLARELIAQLTRRAARPSWELTSLARRFGLR